MSPLPESQVHHSLSFKVALDAFVGQDGEEDISQYQCSTLQDVVAAIAKAEHEQHSVRLNLKIGARLMPILNFVDRYAKAVDVLVQTTSGSLINPAALVWGLLRVLLEVRKCGKTGILPTS
jgi:hypothetical protein